MRPSVRAVSNRYFETMELPIRQGRGVSDQDGADLKSGRPCRKRGAQLLAGLPARNGPAWQPRQAER